MFVRVERGSSVPVSRQIAEQIRAQCLSGMLIAGDSLPSVRQLAQQLAVNVNTVFRVYERLAAEKLIEMRHGAGTFVLPQSPVTEAAGQLSEQRDQYTREFDAIIRRGMLLGLNPTELRRMLTSAMAAVKTEIHENATPSSRTTSSTHQST